MIILETKKQSDSGFREIDSETMDEMVSDPNKVYFIAMVSPRRPGVLLFATMLEHTYYPPGMPENDNFQMFVIKWMEMLWCVIGIPKEDIDRAQEVAEKTGLRFADGIPTLISREGIEFFPVNSPNAYSLENISAHTIYGNLLAEQEALFVWENLEIERAVAESMKRIGQKNSNEVSPR